MPTRQVKPKLQLDGGVLIPAAPVAGAVLTSDGSGNGSWQTPIQPAGHSVETSTGNTNVNISAPGGPFFDGNSLSTGQRLLLTGQTNQVENGIWIYNGTSTPLTRPADWANGTTFTQQQLIAVAYGATYGQQMLLASVQIVGTTPCSFSQTFARPVGVAAGDLAGTYPNPTVAPTNDVPMSGHKITGLANGTAPSDAVNFSQLSGGGSGGSSGQSSPVVIGNGSALTFTITHNLNSQDVNTVVRQTASPYEVVVATVANTTVNTVTLTFATAPTTNQYTVTCGIGIGATGATGAVTLDTWHNVSATGGAAPALTSGYSSFDSIPGYRKDPTGKVLLRGSINHPAIGASSSVAMFTLPAGYRPLTICRFTVFDSNGQALVRVETNGDVTIWNTTGWTSTGASGIVVLDEIEFDTDSVVTVGVGVGGAAPSTVIGDGTARTFTITHNLNSQEVVTVVRQSASPFEQVFPTVANTTANTVTLTFVTAPTTGQFVATCHIGSMLGGSSIPAVIGDGATRVFTITHNLGSQEVDTNVRQSASPFEQVYPTIANTTTNSVTLTFAVAPTTGQYTVTCKVGVPQQLLTTINGPWLNVAALGLTGSPTPWVADTITPQYMIDRLLGFVRFQGKIKNGSNGTSAFVLPVGFRPAQTVEIWGSQDGTTGVAFVIATNGSVTVFAATATTNAVSLDEITFLAASPVLVSSAPQLVTALPGSPAEGQEVYYLADATNGVVWHLRYRGVGNASAYKWEYLGGGRLVSQNDTQDTSTTGAAYIDMATTGPTITIPLAGDYDFEYGFTTVSNLAGQVMYMSPSMGTGVTPLDADAVTVATFTAGAMNGAVAKGRRKTGLTAGMVCKMQYKAGTAQWYVRERWFQVQPVRVG